MAERIDDDRAVLLTAMVRRDIVLHQVNERDEGMRRWIAERTWPSEGTVFDEDLRRDYQSWCAQHGYAEVRRNSLTWSLERAGHARRPWTQKPKARWRQYIGVRLRHSAEPRAADRTELLDFERRLAGNDRVLTDALLRREVAAVPALGAAAGRFHAVDLFVHDACATGSRHAAMIEDLHAAYASWCSHRTVASVPRRYFAELLADLGFPSAHGRVADIPPKFRWRAGTSGQIRLGLAIAPEDLSGRSINDGSNVFVPRTPASRAGSLTPIPPGAGAILAADQAF